MNNIFALDMLKNFAPKLNIHNTKKRIAHILCRTLYATIKHNCFFPPMMEQSREQMNNNDWVETIFIFLMWIFGMFCGARQIYWLADKNWPFTDIFSNFKISIFGCICYNKLFIINNDL